MRLGQSRINSIDPPYIDAYGVSDGLIAKVSPDGAWRFVLKAGGPGDDAASAVGVLPDGRVQVFGVFSEGARFGADTVTSLGAHDLFALRLPGNGW